MQTYEEQQAFFEKNWDALKAALEKDGGPGAVAFVKGFEDGFERRLLFLFGRQGVVMREWAGKNFDAAVDFAKAGIAEMLAEAGSSEEEARRKGLTNQANVLSYNLAADLADCWPGDETPRTPAHFEAGLKAAEDCVRWREELDNGPAALSMAWWAKGMHQLSLGDAAAAKSSWASSLAHAEEAAEDSGDFSVVLGQGYLGLGGWVAGEEDGRAAFERAIATFTAQLEDEKRKGDAQFGIEQLGAVRARYAPGGGVE